MAMTTQQGGQHRGFENLVCWAHVRRRFVDAVRVQPAVKKGSADEAVALIGELCSVLWRDVSQWKDDANLANYCSQKLLDCPAKMR
jgi:hypothetical protein